MEIGNFLDRNIGNQHVFIRDHARTGYGTFSFEQAIRSFTIDPRYVKADRTIYSGNTLSLFDFPCFADIISRINAKIFLLEKYLLENNVDRDEVGQLINYGFLRFALDEERIESDIASIIDRAIRTRNLKKLDNQVEQVDSFSKEVDYLYFKRSDDDDKICFPRFELEEMCRSVADGFRKALCLDIEQVDHVIDARMVESGKLKGELLSVILEAQRLNPSFSASAIPQPKF